MTDKEAAKKLEEAKRNLTRGNGIADFIQVKNEYGRTKVEVEDHERRIKQLEEMFQKQSIIQSSNEIVTSISLQSYLEEFNKHIERQFQEKLAQHTDKIYQMLEQQKEDVKVIMKEKAHKHKVERQISNLNELIRNNEMRIDSIFSGIEMSILKQTSTKAETRDIENLDRAKADISEVKRLEEQLILLQREVKERLDRDAENSEDEYYDEEESE